MDINKIYWPFFIMVYLNIFMQLMTFSIFFEIDIIGETGDIF
ncbi:MAG: hypothetical protein Edafosvirus6_40 [Edafosvirus sp.]|uniref:Uncharacterized protein n=1 Tax=Edafosvirus sp. TaxID=2487765 RepID=A0A3G4ZW20_9VIRU|nr:MAG: hypothetical protein Edafosvirus6_40 [Edafosvirus sp.]